jgi:hypothetical protein
MPAEEGLLKGHTVTINATMRSIDKRDSGAALQERLKRLAKDIGQGRRHANGWSNWIGGVRRRAPIMIGKPAQS